MKESLKDFSIKQLQKYNLPVTEKNLKKLRRKFTAVLKTQDPFDKKEVWKNAEPKIIGRNNVKFFDSKDLTLLEQKIKPYMEKQVIKNATMPVKQLKKEITKNKSDLIEADRINKEAQEQFIKDFTDPNSLSTANANFIPSHSYDMYMENTESLRDEINQIMLEALFNKFFIPAPNWKKRFVQDYNLVNSPNAEQNLDSPLYIDANYRLTHPKGTKSYYQDRK